MTHHTYTTQGTCSMKITFDLDGDIVRNIEFTRGCNGNTKGVASLANGMEAGDLVDRLSGITCDSKNTSCPDQLAKAVGQALKEAAKA